MSAARPAVACPSRPESASCLATAVLSIQLERLKLRRLLLVALRQGDAHAAEALSLARDTLARIAMGLTKAEREVRS